MSRRAHINPDVMMKTWKLHGMGVDNNTIGETLGISEHSVCRIVKIMTTAQNGGDVDAVDGASHRAQKEFAKKMFGIEDKREEAPQEKKNADEDESAILYKAHAAIEKQNKLLERQKELLERLCSAWGV
jgi:DNA-directed RNA polymerase specialized sigma subunit